MDKQCLVNIMSFIAFPWARSTLGFQNMSETKLTDIRLTSGIELEFVLLLRMKAPKTDRMEMSRQIKPRLMHKL